MKIEKFIKNYSPNPRNWIGLDKSASRQIHNHVVSGNHIKHIELISNWIPQELDKLYNEGKEFEIRSMIMRWHNSLNYFRKQYYTNNIVMLHDGYAEYFSLYPKKIPPLWNKEIHFGYGVAFPGTLYGSWNSMMPIVRTLERSIHDGKWFLSYSNLYYPYRLKHFPMAVLRIPSVSQV
jgi:hypothetical protein